MNTPAVLLGKRCGGVPARKSPGGIPVVATQCWSQTSVERPSRHRSKNLFRVGLLLTIRREPSGLMCFMDLSMQG